MRGALKISVVALLVVSAANLALGHWAVGFSTLAVSAAIGATLRRK
jgi:hypothetical protein